MTTSSTSTATGADDTALKAKHRAMWALGDYPAVATESSPDLGPVLVEAAGIGRRRPRARRRRRHRQRRHPGRAPPARDVVATDLTPELLDAGRRGRGRRGRRSTGGGRRRGAAVRRRRVRRGDLVRRRDVRAAPPGRPPTSWCGSAGPAGRSGCSAGRRRASSARCSRP